MLHIRSFLGIDVEKVTFLPSKRFATAGLVLRLAMEQRAVVCYSTVRYEGVVSYFISAEYRKLFVQALFLSP